MASWFCPFVVERYGSPSRRDDLSIGKTHRSPTLAHPGDDVASIA